ncbi:MAG: hypothetical protein ACKVVP_14155 [Chloroflexota bacterium]
MVTLATPSRIKAQTAAELAIAQLETLWQKRERLVARFAPTDTRYHLGRARRAMDHGHYGLAEREAAKALQLDNISPWPLVVLGRSALAQDRPWDAIRAFLMARERAPRNHYVNALLRTAQQQERLAGSMSASVR